MSQDAPHDITTSSNNGPRSGLGAGRRIDHDAGPGRLPVPATAAGRAGLAALLDDPGRALIAVDFDGTLAPIVPDPAQARALPAAVAALRELTPLVGTMAVLTAAGPDRGRVRLA